MSDPYEAARHILAEIRVACSRICDAVALFREQVGVGVCTNASLKAGDGGPHGRKHRIPGRQQLANRLSALIREHGAGCRLHVIIALYPTPSAQNLHEGSHRGPRPAASVFVVARARRLGRGVTRRGNAETCLDMTTTILKAAVLLPLVRRGRAGQR
jgi:hypothetical protein